MSRISRRNMIEKKANPDKPRSPFVGAWTIAEEELFIATTERKLQEQQEQLSAARTRLKEKREKARAAEEKAAAEKAR